MLDHGGHLLQRFRSIAQRFFHGFGIHCATHQIRIILVSCVVITSLFYPALAIYASTQHASILDNFVTSSTITGLDAQKDLVDVWTSYDNTLKVHDDSIARTQCGVGETLRVERLLIQPGRDEDADALTTKTLLSTLDLEQRLEQKLRNAGHKCLTQPNGHCYVLSPLLFWGHNRDVLSADNDILNTISSPAKNITLGGITISPQMVLAQRRSHHPQVAGSRFDFAEYLALTYFFPDSDCVNGAEHASWLDAVQETLGQPPLPGSIKPTEPTIIALEFIDTQSSKGEAWSALSLSLYVAYFGFFTYVAWSVGKMRAVHSRLGVTFTALVEIAVSTITSLSVCALVGFKVTLVPWELLPIVIVFVGAENMFNLVDAVCKTSVTLPVKLRIAEGLSRAGTSNTLKVVTYNTILGLIAAFSVGAVRQFCSFAIVVLVAHWFLAHTFFLAVLSIDIQRLELEELLRHDPSLVPQKLHGSQDNQKWKPRTPWEKLVYTAQNLVKGRAAANLSLVMLLAIAAILYYTSYTAIPKDQQPATPQLSSSISRSHTGVPVHVDSDGYQLWKILNPSLSPSLHLRIEAPNIITLRQRSTSERMASSWPPRPKFTRRTLWFMVWLVKIMILPIAGTTTALWGLLLYLLKNTELLETQRSPSDSNLQGMPDDQKLEKHVTFHTLPRSSPSDIEHIATSKDGSLVASIGLHNEITIQRIRKQNVTIDGTDLLLYDPSTSVCNSTLSCIAVDANGRFVAVGTNTGAIAVWDCKKVKIRSLPLLKLDHSCFAVTELRFASIATVPSTPKQSDFSADGESELSLLATYLGGTAVRWSVQTATASPYQASSRSSVVKASIVTVQPLEHCLIAFIMQNGTVELVDSQEPDPWVFSEFCVQAGDSGSLPSIICAQQVELAGSHRRIVAIATDTGLVSLWDGSTGECISILDDEFGPINTLRVLPVDNGTCRFCGQLPVESVLVAFSVDHTIHLYRLFLMDQTRRCSCFRTPLRHTASRDSFGRRSRSNSTSSQPPSRPVSPSRPKARLATTFETPAFPVSAHGVHSRRASEKENGRRSSELLTVPFPGDDSDGEVMNQSIWNKAILVREKDLSCERGGWGIVGKKVVGIRRKPRAQSKANGVHVLQPSIQESGLTRATMDRWEIWTLDPSTLQPQNVVLSSLSSPLLKASSSVGEVVPRLPFTRISPWTTTKQHAVAGFGNTVGVFSFS